MKKIVHSYATSYKQFLCYFPVPLEVSFEGQCISLKFLHHTHLPASFSREEEPIEICFGRKHKVIFFLSLRNIEMVFVTRHKR